jgi:hypothetical protein
VEALAKHFGFDATRYEPCDRKILKTKTRPRKKEEKTWFSRLFVFMQKN